MLYKNCCTPNFDHLQNTDARIPIIYDKVLIKILEKDEGKMNEVKME